MRLLTQRRIYCIILTFVSVLGLWSGEVRGQTTVFSDDFSTNTNAAWTTTGVITSSAWSATRSGADFGARRNTSPQQLELTNDVGGTANADGWAFAYTSTSSFLTPYNTTLSSNTSLITWTFNMQQIRSDPSGFSSGSYGVAFILGGTNSSPYANGNGYAVVLGQSGSTDPIRLAKYTTGLSGTLTNIKTSNTAGLTDFGADYLSIRVTYNPSNNQWELFLRNDGPTAFVDPTTGTLISQGTVTDNTYTGTSLSFSGGYWSGSTTANQTAFFDNVKITIASTPTLTATPATLSGFNYVFTYGPSASQSYKLNGTNLTPASGNITVTESADYEVSADNITFAATASIPYTGGTITNIPVYVRLKANKSIGDYNSKTIGNSGGGVSNFNVTCNGNVTCAIILAAPNTAVTENFNSLANSGTSSTVPCGWSFLEIGGNTLYTAGDGSLPNGDTYSFGTGTSTERAFGSLLSGSVATTIGAQVKNNTGGIINTLTIQYYGEQWRLGTIDREDRLDFQYSLDANSIATGTATWIDVNPLDFVAPVTTAPAGPLDGNIASNQGLVSSDIFGLTIPNGASFWIRWNDFNAASSDDGLAIDDFSITALPPCALSISSFAPASGPIGTQVIINGSNFTNITNVQFNGINSVFTVNSSTQITTTVPAGNTSGFITIINNIPCSVTSVSGFTTVNTDCSFALDLIISEYVEGSSTNKAIEIVNLTGGAKNLLGYKLVMYFNGSTSIGNTVTLPIADNIANNGVYVVVPSDAIQALKDKAQFIAPASGWFNGDDAVVLMNGTTIIDIFGNIGCDPGTSWTSGSLSTYDHTLVRKSTVFSGITTDPANTPCSFPTLATEWDQYDVDDFSHLGSHGASAGTPPTITPLLPQTICEGNNANFSVTASLGVSPYLFVWKVLDNTGSWATVNNVAPYTITSTTTTSSLDITNALSTYNNYQYYCEVTNSGDPCFKASNGVLLKVVNQWTGASSASWEANGNWNCGVAPVLTTNVILPTAPIRMPTIGSSIAANCRDLEIQPGATLTIQSDATWSGSLIMNGAYSGAGNVIYNRYQEADKWHILSSPLYNTGNQTSISSGNVAQSNGSYNVALYDEFSNEWIYQPSLPIPFAKGKGYVVKLSTGNTIVSYTGTLNATMTDVDVQSTGGYYGWNSVGNPFTSALKITETTNGFLDVNADVLESSYSAIYLWSADATSYKVISKTGYVPKYGFGSFSDAEVQAGQGFLINVKSPQLPEPGYPGGTIHRTITFNHGTAGMQVHNSTTTLKKSESSWSGITLLATNNCRIRSSIVAFNERMTTGLDPSYDAGLLSASDFNLYTQLVAGGNETHFTIQCLPDTMYSSLSVPIGIDLPQPGTLNFKVAGIILPDGVYPVIEDRLLQVNTPLKTETDSLTVDIAIATWGTGRFYLRFGETTINTGINTLPESPVFTARYANQRITLFGAPEQGCRAWLYDINGRKLSGEYQLTTANQNEIPATGLSSGIYMLKIEGKTYRQTLKITVLSQ